MILADYKIQDNKFHIAGPSNGGIAAFHVAAANPQYFLSVTAFPGYMWEPSAAKLQAISKMCVFMYVGENDPYMWHDEMKREAESLRSEGTVARYTVEKGQPHRHGNARRAPTPGACSTDLRKPRRAAGSKKKCAPPPGPVPWRATRDPFLPPPPTSNLTRSAAREVIFRLSRSHRENYAQQIGR